MPGHATFRRSASSSGAQCARRHEGRRSCVAASPPASSGLRCSSCGHSPRLCGDHRIVPRGGPQGYSYAPPASGRRAPAPPPLHRPPRVGWQRVSRPRAQAPWRPQASRRHPRHHPSSPGLRVPSRRPHGQRAPAPPPVHRPPRVGWQRASRPRAQAPQRQEANRKKPPRRRTRCRRPERDRRSPRGQRRSRKPSRPGQASRHRRPAPALPPDRRPPRRRASRARLQRRPSGERSSHPVRGRPATSRDPRRPHRRRPRSERQSPPAHRRPGLSWRLNGLRAVSACAARLRPAPLVVRSSPWHRRPPWG
jgi:hypothetical protein